MLNFTPSSSAPSPFPASILNRFEQRFLAFRPASAAVTGEFEGFAVLCFIDNAALHYVLGELVESHDFLHGLFG